MNCIIIDDELTAQLIINKLCKQIPNINVVEQFSNAFTAIKYLLHVANIYEDYDYYLNLCLF